MLTTVIEIGTADAKSDPFTVSGTPVVVSIIGAGLKPRGTIWLEVETDAGWKFSAELNKDTVSGSVPEDGTYRLHRIDTGFECGAARSGA